MTEEEIMQIVVVGYSHYMRYDVATPVKLSHEMSDIIRKNDDYMCKLGSKSTCTAFDALKFLGYTV